MQPISEHMKEADKEHYKIEFRSTLSKENPTIFNMLDDVENENSCIYIQLYTRYMALRHNNIMWQHKITVESLVN